MDCYVTHSLSSVIGDVDKIGKQPALQITLTGGVQ